jgi:hypothetical protein
MSNQCANYSNALQALEKEVQSVMAQAKKDPALSVEIEAEIRAARQGITTVQALLSQCEKRVVLTRSP